MVKRKNQLEKQREQQAAERSKINKDIHNKVVHEEQEAVLGNLKFRDIITNEYMKSLFIDPNKLVMGGSLSSDQNKKYLYITKQNKKSNHSNNNVIIKVLIKYSDLKGRGQINLRD